MAKKEDEETKDVPEYAAISIASLAEEFGGNVGLADLVMQEIGELGGFGRASEFSTFALIDASDDVQKEARAIINKAKKESEKSKK